MIGTHEGYLENHPAHAVAAVRRRRGAVVVIGCGAPADIGAAGDRLGLRRQSRSDRARSARMDSRLIAGATLVRTANCPVLLRDQTASAPGTVAHAGVIPTLEGRAQQDALRQAIAPRRGYCSWDVDHAGCKWVVILHAPEE